MIATVHKASDEGEVLFVLDEEGWASSDPRYGVIADLLNLRFPLSGESPAHGRPGAKLAGEAADFLGGTVELPPAPPEEPGTIY